MPLFGSGAPKFKWTRPMVIVAGVFGFLLVALIALGVFLLVNNAQSNKTAAKPTLVATATIKVAEVQRTEPTLAGQATALPQSATKAAAPATVPPATGGGAVLPTAMQTPIPPPTAQTTAQTGGGGINTQGTPPAGGGETQQLPGGSSGLTWLIPVGIVLLVAVVWWRWRRSRAEH